MTDLPTLRIGLNAAALDAAWLVWKSGYKDFCRKNKIRNRPIVEGEDGTFEGGWVSAMEYAQKEIDRIVKAHAAAHQKEVDDVGLSALDCIQCREKKRKDADAFCSVHESWMHSPIIARDAVLKLLPKEEKR